MAAIGRIVDDLRLLSVLEAAELSKALEQTWGISPAAPVAAPKARATRMRLLSVLKAFPAGNDAEDWIAAELIALRGEAVRLADSLDATLAYVTERCSAVRASA